MTQSQTHNALPLNFLISLSLFLLFFCFLCKVLNPSTSKGRSCELKHTKHPQRNMKSRELGTLGQGWSSTWHGRGDQMCKMNPKPRKARRKSQKPNVQWHGVEKKTFTDQRRIRAQLQNPKKEKEKGCANPKKKICHQNALVWTNKTQCKVHKFWKGEMIEDRSRKTQKKGHHSLIPTPQKARQSKANKVWREKEIVTEQKMIFT